MQTCCRALHSLSLSNDEGLEPKNVTEQLHWRMAGHERTSVDAHVVIAVERVAHAAACLGGGHRCSGRHWHGAGHLAAKCPAHPPARCMLQVILQVSLNNIWDLAGPLSWLFLLLWSAPPLSCAGVALQASSWLRNQSPGLGGKQLLQESTHHSRNVNCPWMLEPEAISPCPVAVQAEVSLFRQPCSNKRRDAAYRQ